MSERAVWASEGEYKPRHVHIAMDDATRGLLIRDTCRRFHDLMDAAMLVSGMPDKYGPVADGYPEKVRACAINAKETRAKDFRDLPTLEKRLAMYRETGNVEYLVDVANMAMIEFMHPRHPKAHYTPTDASGSPGRSTIAGSNQMSNKDLTLIANG